MPISGWLAGARASEGKRATQRITCLRAIIRPLRFFFSLNGFRIRVSRRVRARGSSLARARRYIYMLHAETLLFVEGKASRASARAHNARRTVQITFQNGRRDVNDLPFVSAQRRCLLTQFSRITWPSCFGSLSLSLCTGVGSGFFLIFPSCSLGVYTFLPPPVRISSFSFQFSQSAAAFLHLAESRFWIVASFLRIR